MFLSLISECLCLHPTVGQRTDMSLRMRNLVGANDDVAKAALKFLLVFDEDHAISLQVCQRFLSGNFLASRHHRLTVV